MLKLFTLVYSFAYSEHQLGYPPPYPCSRGLPLIPNSLLLFLRIKMNIINEAILFSNIAMVTTIILLSLTSSNVDISHNTL